MPGDEEAALIHGALVHEGLLLPDCEILELGCGAGRVTMPLSALGHHVVAVDQSEAMLAEVRRRVPEAVPVLGDIESLDLGRRVAAVVLGSHLVNAETGLGAAFLATCRRHVATGGTLAAERAGDLEPQAVVLHLRPNAAATLNSLEWVHSLCRQVDPTSVDRPQATVLNRPTRGVLALELLMGREEVHL